MLQKKWPWIFLLALAALGLVLYPNFYPAPRYFGINKQTLNKEKVAELAERAPAVDEHFRFIAFGDNRAGTLFTDQATKAIFEKMREEKDVAFVVNTGDQTFHSKEAHYRAYERLTDMLPFPVLNVIGNHDVYDRGRDYFAHYLGESNFTFVYGPAYFVFFDNSSGKFEEGQESWLETQLASGSGYAHKIVVVHRPPFDPHFDPAKPLDFENFRNHTGFWGFGEASQAIYESHGVDLVVAGHFHYFDEQKLNGIRYITTGGGGIIITEDVGGYFHYVVVDVYPDRVDYEVRIVPAPLWQRLVYYNWKNLFYRARAAWRTMKARPSASEKSQAPTEAYSESTT